MPRSPKPSVTLEPEFEDHFHKMLKTKEGSQQLQDAMQIFAMLFDNIIEGKNTWMVIGRSKQTHKLLLTLHEQDVDSYASGSTLEGFLSELQAL